MPVLCNFWRHPRRGGPPIRLLKNPSFSRPRHPIQQELGYQSLEPCRKPLLVMWAFAALPRRRNDRSWVEEQQVHPIIFVRDQPGERSTYGTLQLVVGGDDLLFPESVSRKALQRFLQHQRTVERSVYPGLGHAAVPCMKVAAKF